MTYCPGCNQSIHAESELERLREEIAHLRKSIANSDRDHWYEEAKQRREAPPFNPDPELADRLRGKYPPLRDLRDAYGIRSAIDQPEEGW